MKWFRDTGDLGVSSFQLRAIGRAWEGEEEGERGAATWELVECASAY